ncbi:MAG: chorismate mutase [Solirubrobacteraceae bacterium]
MSGGESRMHGLRGAITVEHNDSDEILRATTELMQTLKERNGLAPEDVVSCIFTLTDDLDAQFPAVAARALGFQHVPLLCAREIPVPGSLPMVIRVLIHYYPSDGSAPSHVYLRGASALRADLQAAQ